MEIADRLRAARVKKGWTQAQLAKLLGVSRGAIGQWEGGGARTKKPGRDNLLRAAHILQISVSELLGDVSPSVLSTSDPDEITILELHRSFSARLKDVHLRLTYELAGLDVGEMPEKGPSPSNRKRIAS
jgi:transcriptional regulator with XRE-family HTH domain